MTGQQTMVLSCPAKVNLALAVGAARTDGYHPIASWMVAVNFSDSLALRVQAVGESSFAIIFADDAPVVQSVDWPIDCDLAYRAHQLLQAHVGRPLPVGASISKRIPAGAGLGGGSSDAAAMLVGLDKLFDLQLPHAQLSELAAGLGCDVGFALSALHGCASMLATNLGEVLESAPRKDVLHLALILPPFTCPTRKVYSRFDELSIGQKVPDEKRVRALIAQAPLSQDGPFNDLAEAACDVQPKLRQTLEQLREEMKLPVHVTGSGAAMFIIAPSALAAKVLARKVTSLTGFPAVATRTLG